MLLYNFLIRVFFPVLLFASLFVLNVEAGKVDTLQQKMKSCKGSDQYSRIVACTAIIKDSKASDVEKMFAYTFRSNVYYLERKYDLLIPDMTKVIELDSRRAGRVRAYVTRAYAYFHKGFLNKALSDYHKAIELSPQKPEGYNGRGIVYAKQGKYDLAIKEYSKAINIFESFGEAYIKRAQAFVERGQVDLAIRDLTKAIELGPRLGHWGIELIEIHPLFIRGTIYLNTGQFKKAVRDFSGALALDPLKAKYFAYRGMALEKLGDKKHALSDFQRALELMPCNATYKRDVERLSNFK